MRTDGVPTQVRRYLDHLAVERGLAANTVSSYRRDLRRYQQYLLELGVEDLGGVQSSHVTSFLQRLGEGDAEHRAVGAASAGRMLAAVRGLHRFALREGITSHDPAAEVRPPSTPKRLPKALSIAEVEALLAAAGENTPRGLRDRALLELLYASGARISEVVGLDVDDLDRPLASAGEARAGADAPAGHANERGTGVVLVRGKGRRERLVPIGSYAMSAIEAYLVRGRPALAAAHPTGRPAPALFLNARGGRLSRQSAWTVLVSAADRAGLPSDVSPHTLRHSFATHLLDGGADVRAVQELLGHASVTTTQIYTLVTVDKLREDHAASHPRAR
jgi:integrase/recombinase XerD